MFLGGKGWEYFRKFCWEGLYQVKDCDDKHMLPSQQAVRSIRQFYVLNGYRIRLFAAGIVLFVPDCRRGHDVPLCGEVILLEVDAHLDPVCASALVDVPQIDLVWVNVFQPMKGENILLLNLRPWIYWPVCAKHWKGLLYLPILQTQGNLLGLGEHILKGQVYIGIFLSADHTAIRQIYHVTVVCPRSEFHEALLLVEGEELNVDFARRLVDGGRVPQHLAGVVQDGLGHDCHLVVAVSTEKNNLDYTFLLQ